jgi:hypothetical protein
MLHTFEFLAQENFSFLITKYNFHIDNTCTTSVCWNREEYNVEITFDKYRSYELQLRLSFKGRKNVPSYYLDEILQLTNIKDVSYISQASTPERLLQGILKISSLFQEVCKKLDLFNQKTFDMLAAVRKKNCDDYEIQKIRRNVSVEGDKYWQEKKYKEIVLLYKNNINLLKKHELKRYEYAQRQLKNK